MAACFCPNRRSARSGYARLWLLPPICPAHLNSRAKLSWTLTPAAWCKPPSPAASKPGHEVCPRPVRQHAKGDILAYVLPSVGAIERSGQAAQLAELRSARALAEKRLARLRDLSDTVPRKEIDTAEAELSSLTERVSAIGGGLSTREALIAPVSGVIASAKAVAGQVVDAREIVFEVVNPARLHIEALAYDIEAATSIASATLALGTERVALQYVGSARSLREQALPVMFKAEGAALGKLAVGQSVRVFVRALASTRPQRPRRGTGEESGQPDHGMGQNGTGTLRIAHSHARAARRYGCGRHFRTEGRRARGDPGRLAR